MAWSEFQRIPNEYNEEVRAIDEQLLRLVVERRRTANGKRYVPGREILEAWAQAYDMEIAQINWFIHALNGTGGRPVMPNELGELRQVVPILKKTALDGYVYQITHAMQHEHGSLVFVEIEGQPDLDGHVHVRPQLLLDVTGSGDYEVRRSGASGGGRAASLRYTVTPRLPDELSEVAFSLIPYANPMESAAKEIILDQTVKFD